MYTHITRDTNTQTTISRQQAEALVKLHYGGNLSTTLADYVISTLDIERVTLVGKHGSIRPQVQP